MTATARIETALEGAFARFDGSLCPPQLRAAVRYAVFPGGARVRPRLCLSVGRACAEDAPALTDAAATAVELLHCASLVHDDLPCFDDAAMRRGKPSVHRAYDERTAVLTGDALIVMAFQVLAEAAPLGMDRLAPLVACLGRGVGLPGGIVAGQAWECEPAGSAAVDRGVYHRAKTGALFVAATSAGAIAAGQDGAPWRRLGQRIGEAFQVADDLHDAAGNSESLGKPTGQDVALDRPSAVRELGIKGAVDYLNGLLREAVDSIPPCPGAGELRAELLAEGRRFLPKGLTLEAA